MHHGRNECGLDVWFNCMPLESREWISHIPLERDHIAVIENQSIGCRARRILQYFWKRNYPLVLQEECIICMNLLQLLAMGIHQQQAIGVVIRRGLNCCPFRVGGLTKCNSEIN